MRKLESAFPQQPIFTDRGRGLEFADGWGYGGMTLRDWFAGQALNGILASYSNNENVNTAEASAKEAVARADALLIELEKG